MVLKNSTLPRRAKCCALKNESFLSGSVYFSTLSEEGERADYCPHCWEKIADNNKKFFWKGKVPAKKAEPLSRDEQALAYFRALYAESKKVKTLFVLAQYGGPEYQEGRSSRVFRDKLWKYWRSF